MTEPKFTPGPWSYRQDNATIEAVGAVAIADVRFSGVPDDDADANGYLIAAAPELYAALEGLFDTLIGASLCPFGLAYVKRGHFDASHDVECPCNYHAAVNAARAALAKAGA